jgi:hypothetical protein
MLTKTTRIRFRVVEPASGAECSSVGLFGSEVFERGVGVSPPFFADRNHWTHSLTVRFR